MQMRDGCTPVSQTSMMGWGGLTTGEVQGGHPSACHAAAAGWCSVLQGGLTSRQKLDGHLLSEVTLIHTPHHAPKAAIPQSVQLKPGATAAYINQEVACSSAGIELGGSRGCGRLQAATGATGQL